MLAKYEQLVTGRAESLFTADLRDRSDDLARSLEGTRIAVVGAAGSIGGAVVKTLLRFFPTALVLVDLNENNLVELVRDLRSADGLVIPKDFVTLPVGLGSFELRRFFGDHPPYDYFFNLSALKHVRSERHVYSLMRMVETNILALHEFLESTSYRFRKVFSVSSDKAANPRSLMGATKMIMERVLLLRSDQQPFSTARFANVAFSDGSLPYGFLQRFAKQQPIAAPNDVRRYFISHQEAGELCVLAGALGENRDVFFPKLLVGRDEKTFAEVATIFLKSKGYRPHVCTTEDDARKRIVPLLAKNEWPCFFFKSDTTGEKEYEEFFREGETPDLTRFQHIGIIHRPVEPDPLPVHEFLTFAKAARKSRTVTKSDYVTALSRVVPDMNHRETGRNLDEKM